MRACKSTGGVFGFPARSPDARAGAEDRKVPRLLLALRARQRPEPILWITGKQTVHKNSGARVLARKPTPNDECGWRVGNRLTSRPLL